MTLQGFCRPEARSVGSVHTGRAIVSADSGPLLRWQAARYFWKGPVRQGVDADPARQQQSRTMVQVLDEALRLDLRVLGEAHEPAYELALRYIGGDKSSGWQAWALYASSCYVGLA